MIKNSWFNNLKPYTGEDLKFGDILLVPMKESPVKLIFVTGNDSVHSVSGFDLFKLKAPIFTDFIKLYSLENLIRLTSLAKKLNKILIPDTITSDQIIKPLYKVTHSDLLLLNK